jgi:hypothetical protein
VNHLADIQRLQDGPTHALGADSGLTTVGSEPIQRYEEKLVGDESG